MDIKTLGAHNCESQDTKLSSILIDDVLLIDAGAATSSLTLKEQRDLKAVCLTHQHYDHIKDIPLLGFNFAMGISHLEIFSSPEVFSALKLFMGNSIYPDFLEFPPGTPSLSFNPVTAYHPEQIAGYQVLPVPVNHSVFTLGYQITSPDGKSVFYTGDTGPCLGRCWDYVSPQLLITEVSAPDRFEDFYKKRRHLTPRLLMRELDVFQGTKGYLPQVVIVHMNPELEDEIKTELKAVSQTLGHPIIPAHEGMVIRL